MNDPKNPKLKERLLKQEISPHDLLTKDPRELASDSLKKQREETLLRNLQMRRNDWDNEVTSSQSGFKGLFKCEECGSMRTGFIQLQIERADEPMTNFIYCYDCFHRYKC